MHSTGSVNIFLAFFVFRRRSYVRCLHAQLYKYFDTIRSKVSLLFPKISLLFPKKDTVHRKKIIDIGEAHDALLDAFHDLIHHPLTTELRGC